VGKPETKSGKGTFRPISIPDLGEIKTTSWDWTVSWLANSSCHYWRPGSRSCYRRLDPSASRWSRAETPTGSA